MMSGVFSESLPLADLLVRSAQAHPERTALAFPDRRYTYADLLEGATRTARSLRAAGVGSGDHVGLLMPNSVEFVESMFGAALLGAVLVPLNARFRSAELGYVIAHAELSVVLTSDAIATRTDFRAILGESLPSLPGSDPDAPLRLAEAPRLRHVVVLDGDSGGGCLGGDAFRALAERVDPHEIDTIRARVRSRDTALILYTSGTTAHPKGCLISHESITRGSVGRMRETVPLTGEPPVFWCPLPLFHIASLQVFLASIGVGATFVTDVFYDAGRALEQIRQMRVTSLWPWFFSTMNGLLADPSFTGAQHPELTSISLVGPPAALREVQARFPAAKLINGSGMSEMAGYFAISPMDDDDESRATWVGKPVSGVEVRIIDPETGQDVGPDTLGELLLRGYSMMTGYYRDPERTRQTIDEDGWLHTGDLFRLSHDGHVRYEGRLKDMLKVGGENVPAIEVEAFLCTHPAVAIAEVVGRPDDRLDEVAVAFVELAPGSTVTADELIEYCRGRIASFKVPRAVYFKTATEWPMSATKVNKVALRREVAELAARERTVEHV
jgi:fatty-acyl-CoA synthase/long-chain acyl-CoA synthetase